MKSLIRNKDFLSGFLFVGAGAAFLWLGQDYALGTTRRMGPGYFPMVLSVILILIGAGVMFNAMKSEEYVSDFSWRGMIAVALGTLAFGVTIRGAGIIVAVMLLVLVSALGNPRSKWIPMLALAIGMAAFSYAIFVRALGLPIPVIGPWLSLPGAA